MTSLGAAEVDARTPYVDAHTLTRTFTARAEVENRIKEPDP